MRMIFNQFKTYSLFSTNIFLERFDSLLTFLFNFSFFFFATIHFSSLQNLRVKYYKEGDWISENKLAEGLK